MTIHDIRRHRTAPPSMTARTNATACVRGVGLLGPGLDDWLTGAAVLAGNLPYTARPTVVPNPSALPPAERRRTGTVVKIALATGFEAACMAQVNPAALPTVFSSSGGDGYNCHEICQTLASSDRQLSPTRFHNSVHNAASGYWSIAANATPASSVLCAFDASFGAGLLEALTQVAVDRTPVLLIAYDVGYPEPLHARRPIPDGFGVAMVLEPVGAAESARKSSSVSVTATAAPENPSQRSLVSAPAPTITATLTDAPADRMGDAQLEELRTAIPAARSLPLLAQLARAQTGRVVLDYLEMQRIAIEVSSWR